MAISNTNARVQNFSPTYRPWEQSWYAATGPDRGVLAWIMLIHATALLGLVLYPMPGWPPGNPAAGAKLVKRSRTLMVSVSAREADSAASAATATKKLH